MGMSGVVGPVTPAKLARASGMTSVTRTALAAGRALFKRKGAATGRARGTKLRRRNKEGTGSYSQWTQDYKAGRFGRLTGKKIDSLSYDRVIYCHRRIGPFNDYGQVWLSNYFSPNSTQFYPLFLFELNSCNNMINGVYTGAAPVVQLTQNGTNMNWEQFYAQNPNGTLGSAYWQQEMTGHTAGSAGSVPLMNAIHKWSSLDLELWGCRNKPTKYHICLCQFSEDVLPDFGTAVNQAAEFWQAMVKHYTYSPLAKMDDGFNRKKMKILKQYTYNIDPTANFENDPDPHVKTVKLFYKFNRKTNFAWKFSDPQVQGVVDMNDPDWRQEVNSVQTNAHPNARIYVMVRASNFTKITSPNPITNDTTPSFSWRMRTCWMVNN